MSNITYTSHPACDPAAFAALVAIFHEILADPVDSQFVFAIDQALAADPTARITLAWLGDQASGAVVGRLDSPDRAEIGSLAVLHHARGRGLSKQLIAHCVRDIGPASYHAHVRVLPSGRANEASAAAFTANSFQLVCLEDVTLVELGERAVHLAVTSRGGRISTRIYQLGGI